MIPTWLANLFVTTRRPRPAVRPRRVMRLEVLEDRDVPSTLVSDLLTPLPTAGDAPAGSTTDPPAADDDPARLAHLPGDLKWPANWLGSAWFYPDLGITAPNLFPGGGLGFPDTVTPPAPPVVTPADPAPSSPAPNPPTPPATPTPPAPADPPAAETPTAYQRDPATPPPRSDGSARTPDPTPPKPPPAGPVAPTAARPAGPAAAPDASGAPTAPMSGTAAAPPAPQTGSTTDAAPAPPPGGATAARAPDMEPGTTTPATDWNWSRPVPGSATAPAPSDGVLLRRFAADREQAAFTELVQRHGRSVLAVCTRVLGDADRARDASQATFLALARRAAGLDDRGSLAGWLYKVAYRVSLRHRTAAARQRRLERAAAQSLDRDDGIFVGIEEEEIWRVLTDELDRLPEKYRVPLVLCYLDGRTHAEVARAVGLPRGSIAKRIAEGLDRLRESLAGRGFVT